MPKMLSGSQTKRLCSSWRDFIACYLTSWFDIYGELNVDFKCIWCSLFIDVYCSNESESVQFDTNLAKSGTVEV